MTRTRAGRRALPYRSEGAAVGAEGPTSEINVTPLVDVCLVLLIIFMVVTPMLSRGRDVNLPVVTTAQEHREGSQVFVSVDRAGAWLGTDVYVERRGFLDALAEALQVARGKATARGDQGPLLFVKGDQDAHYGRVRTVLQWIEADPRTQQHDLALVVELQEAK